MNEVACALGKLTGIPVFDKMVQRAQAPAGSPRLKDLRTREEKEAALAGRVILHEVIRNEGCWNALLIDDLFDTGATMNAACRALRGYRKIGRIYAAAVTWK